MATMVKRLVGALAAVLAMTGAAWAHCDTLDGPVVKAAQQALASGDVKPVLIWVKKADEGEIVGAFQKALAVRKLNPAAKDLADKFFFETLVRVHRAGEGAPFTGLKPAGSDLGPAVPAGDHALQTGSSTAIAGMLAKAVQHRLDERFAEVMAKKNFDKNDLAAGRVYVAAYVAYIHYVEQVYEVAAASPAHGHDSEAPAAHMD